jgi:broad specificity phosphatase PhoE
VRHGEVALDWQGRIYGDLDVPLSPRGEQEARAAAERLASQRLAAVISSGLARAEYGAALLRAGRGLPRRDEPALREIARGAWRGLRPEEVPDAGFAAWLCAADVRRPPEGESLGDLAARVFPCLERLGEEHAGARLAVVTHHWVLRIALARARGLPLADAPRLEFATGAIAVVDWLPGSGPAEPADLAPGELGPA